MDYRIATLISAAVRYDHGDPRRIHHFMKVHGFAATIGAAEGLTGEELFILEAAAVLHDIGIHRAEELYGDCSGPRQEQLGPDIAREILETMVNADAAGNCSPAQDTADLQSGRTENFSPAQIDRICWLIANHHHYSGVTSLDHRILLEADFLVNAYEDKLPAAAIITFRDKVFRTPTGLRLLNDLFDLR